MFRGNLEARVNRRKFVNNHKNKVSGCEAGDSEDRLQGTSYGHLLLSALRASVAASVARRPVKAAHI